MAKDYVLVRKINGLETAGSLSLLFTEGRLSVVELATGNVTTFREFSEMDPALAVDVITGIGVNNSAVASNGAIIRGNSTDRALMSFLVDKEADGDLSKSKEEVRNFNAFDSNKKSPVSPCSRMGKVNHRAGPGSVPIESCHGRGIYGAYLYRQTVPASLEDERLGLYNMN